MSRTPPVPESLQADTPSRHGITGTRDRMASPLRADADPRDRALLAALRTAGALIAATVTSIEPSLHARARRLDGTAGVVICAGTLRHAPSALMERLNQQLRLHAMAGTAVSVAVHDGKPCVVVGAHRPVDCSGAVLATCIGLRLIRVSAVVQGADGVRIRYSGG